MTCGTFIFSVPFAAPRNVVVTSVNATFVRISWSLPEAEKQNGVIIGYEVATYGETSGSKIEKLSSSLMPSSVTSWSSNKLDSHVGYIFHIKAGTAKGFGPSAIIYKKSEGLWTVMKALSQCRFTITKTSHVISHVKNIWNWNILA